jgi:hypothetical protein
MADFEAPTGPPPSKVPEGWVARWDEKYKEWFYVNLHTKKSQWNKPTEPARPAEETGPDGPPPSYMADPSKPAPTDTKRALESNNPYNQHGSSSTDDDAKLAAQLQAEEDARARKSSDRGAGQDYYNQGSQYNDPNQGSYPQNLPPRPQESSRGSGGGFLGKLLGKGKGHSPQPSYQSSSPQPYGGQPQYYPPQQQQGYYGGGYPPQQPPYGGYGGYGPGGYPPQQAVQQSGRRPGGGLGAGGAAALGLGGGLLGGALLADAFDGGDDGGGDYGGGDDGGGGGDF